MLNIILNLSTYFLGDMEKQEFLACYLFAILGVVVRLLINETSVAASKNSHVYNWTDIIKNNGVKMVLDTILTLLLIYVFIRFSSELLGLTISMFVSFIIGLIYGSLKGLILKIGNSIKKDSSNGNAQPNS